MHDLDRTMLETDPMVGKTASAEHREFLEILGGLLHGRHGRVRLVNQQEQEAVGPFEMQPAHAWGSAARLSAGQTGLGSTAARALAGGERNENTLTDMAFADRHPELEGRVTRADERDLAHLWLQVRDMVVRPTLRALTPFPIRPPSPAASSGMDWMAGVNQVRSTHDGGSMLGGPPRLLWHTYEANPQSLTAHNAAKGLIAAGNEVHFTLNPISGDIVPDPPGHKSRTRAEGSGRRRRDEQVRLRSSPGGGVRSRRSPFTAYPHAGRPQGRVFPGRIRGHMGRAPDLARRSAADLQAVIPARALSSAGHDMEDAWWPLRALAGPENTHGDPGAIDTSMLYPLELGQEVSETAGTAGDFDDRAAREVELASDLLEVQTAAELGQFIGTLLRRAGGATTTLAHSDTGRALGGILKQAARQALPIGSAVDSGSAPQQRDLRGGTSLGLELEGLSSEDREFETARAVRPLRRSGVL